MKPRQFEITSAHPLMTEFVPSLLAAECLNVVAPALVLVVIMAT